MSGGPALEGLCRWCGITGRVPDETRRALLRAMGVPVDGPAAQLAETLDALENRAWLRGLPPVKVVWAEAGDWTLECVLPDPVGDAPLAWNLALESGESRTGVFPAAGRMSLAERVVGGRAYRRYPLGFAALPPGYHRLSLECPEQGFAADMALIAAPGRCHTAPILREKARVWGISLPLYAVRSQRNWGMGDFTDLRGAVDYAADQGAAVLLAGLRPAHPAPGWPDSRRFWDFAYLDLEAIPDYAESVAIRERVATAEFQAKLRSLRAGDTVDYREVRAFKLDIAAVLYAHFRECHLEFEAADARGEAFRAYRAARGADLYRQTLFDALSEQHWPVAQADPESPEVRAFAGEHAGRLGFYAYLYWQAEVQFAAVAERAREAGLAVGLGLEFALAPAAAGAEVWAAPDRYAAGVRIAGGPGRQGAVPPLPGALRESAYAPFVAALRRAMRQAGVLLIRDALDLWRQCWVPAGNGTGAWVEFPHADLLGIVALESRRQRCMVLADAAGLPEEALAALETIRALPFRPLFVDARQPWPVPAAAVAATGEDRTLRGFWLGRDLEGAAAARRFPSEADRHEEAIARAVARMRLLVALERERLLPPEFTIHPTAAPDMTVALRIATYRYLYRAPARMVLVPMADALGQAEVSVEPAGGCRKLCLDVEQWRADTEAGALWMALADIRPGKARLRPRPAPSQSGGVVRAVPDAIYRLQFGRRFTFRRAARLAGYLHELGISHGYASPYLRARPGSGHGYDIVDHGAINPEIGGRAGLERWVRELARHGMGHILDLVPNHMGVMGADNAWWLDVLENGEASDYAGFFDIDWSPLKEELRGKVLLPILGAPYGTALESGAIELRFDAGRGVFSAGYGPHRFPIDPREYPRILAYRLEQLEGALEPALCAEFQSLVAGFGHLPGRWQTAEAKRAERNRDKEVHKRHLARLCAGSRDLAYFLARNVAAFNGASGFDHLHELLDRQAYRLAYWRIAVDEINYRRFFDTNDLAALSMEREEVFSRTHGLVLELIAAGKLHGLRIDHPDGLYDPEAYFHRLRERIAALEPAYLQAGRAVPVPAAGEGAEFYIVAEKILEAGEELPASWPVQGTTGYDFANLVNGLWVWPGAEAELERFYRDFCGVQEGFDEGAYQAKRLILKVALSAELSVLANRLGRIAESDRRTRDYSLTGLRDALREIIACFPVYRTYIAGRRVAERDAAYIERAVAEAKRRSAAGDLSVFDFVREVLLGVQAEGRGERYREQCLGFAMKFQQVTGPVMAKGIEDTLFYRQVRLASLNEVGGDPRRFAVSLDEFHRANQARAARWPNALLCTSTHDTKRSEDVRARLDVLSEIPGEWTAAVARWHALNRPHKIPVEGGPAPSNNDEYLLYQTLLGTWPPAGPDPFGSYRGRLEAYMVKALREAKLYSSWLNPNHAYEEATLSFLARLLDPAGDGEFLADFREFQAGLVRPGFHNSLAQVLFKLTAPGVPDIYQGSELWDFSLVDPDNRRPVDFRRRRALLRGLRAWDGCEAGRLAELLDDMLRHMDDGRVKFYVTRETLRLRRRLPELFRRGGYRPLAAEGGRAEHICAYAREYGPHAVLAVAPRWTRRLLGAAGRPGDPALWGDTRIVLPNDLHGAYCDAYTRERRVLDGAVGPAGLLARFPLALLVRAD